MALISPGVEVTIIDESNYIPSATNSVPYILLATAANKINGTGTGIAPGTLAANANNIYLITSQRDLVATFGNPFFYKTSAGTPINGYELNEYGLLAAYSTLGISNRAYIQRADIDLSELTASLVRPTGAPPNGTFWLNTADTAWGIFAWNLTTNSFSLKAPIVITDSSKIEPSPSTAPRSSVGSIGDYAINTLNSNNPVYFKDSTNTWVLVGSDAWKLSIPTITGANTVTGTLNAAEAIVINGITVLVPAAPNNTLNGLVGAINAATIQGVVAANVSNRLVLYADSTATADGSTANGGAIVLDFGTQDLFIDLGVQAQTYYAPAFQASPHYTVPRWSSFDANPKPTGSVWNKITNVNNGANMVVSKYDATLGVFVEQGAPIYQNDQSANKALDPAGGGINIPAGTTYTQYDVSENNTFTLKLFERATAGRTVIVGDETAPAFSIGTTFTIEASQTNNTALTSPVTVTLTGSTAADFCSDVSLANVADVSAEVTASGAIQFIHSRGGVIVLKDTFGTPVSNAGFNTSVEGVRAGNDSNLILSNWVALTYTASASEPNQDPADGRRWYYSAVDQVDIMMHDGTNWRGYRNVTLDARGYNLTGCDPNGPICAASAPTAQSDDTPLVYGDIWVDTSDLENYPMIYRWQNVDSVDQWVLIDNTDNTGQNGILFADARWDNSGSTDIVTGDIIPISTLTTSDYLDLDAPDPSLYPDGMLLFNSRRSGFNVKSYQSNYFNATSYPDDTLPAVKDTWLTVSGLKDDGSPFMGRKAVRNLVVQAMKSAIDTNTELREEQRQFNLIACPQYPELMVNMVALNNERNNTAFIIGDTPLRLEDTGTAITYWATDAGGLGVPDGDGLNTASPYLGVFYPSCQTTDLSGSTVVQPPSHMLLRTIVRNDEVAFPWLAPAGTRRGTVDNASAIGYIDAATGEFQQIATRLGLRDTLYENRVNPLTFIPGVGIVNYGNKTTQAVASALDRINVARLIAFIRGRLTEIGNQFLFEPNDQVTRDEIKNTIEGLMNDLVAKRGIYDYLVVCDESNNTPARIDRNELYVDIAIEPVKAVEFIYIPVRIKNTGEIAAGNTSSSQPV
jgi:hypothetical protein